MCSLCFSLSLEVDSLFTLLTNSGSDVGGIRDSDCPLRKIKAVGKCLKKLINSSSSSSSVPRPSTCDVGTMTMTSSSSSPTQSTGSSPPLLLPPPSYPHRNRPYSIGHQAQRTKRLMKEKQQKRALNTQEQEAMGARSGKISQALK